MGGGTWARIHRVVSNVSMVIFRALLTLLASTREPSSKPSLDASNCVSKLGGGGGLRPCWEEGR